MIRFIQNNLLFIVILIFAELHAQEVDIFSEKNTADFARFLFLSNQYSFAAEEYERLTYVFPENKDYQIGLLKSYRYASEYQKGILAFQGFLSKGYEYGPEIQHEYIKLNLLSENKLNLVSMLDRLGEENSLRNNLDLTLRLISYPDNSLSLEGIKTDRIDPGLLNLYYESSKIKHRSPFLAGAFSTVIPGMGKVYSGRLADGIIAFLFVGATSFGAYRGFEKKGVKSVYGWIWGGLSVGFYIGNIYGSAKAASIYNAQQNSMYVEKVTDYYIDHF